MQVSSEEAAEAPPLEPLDEYVMVEKDDVMEAISAFVAAYLVQLPEAQHLKPDELQRALGGAIAVGPRAPHADAQRGSAVSCSTGPDWALQPMQGYNPPAPPSPLS